MIFSVIFLSPYKTLCLNYSTTFCLIPFWYMVAALYSFPLPFSFSPLFTCISFILSLVRLFLILRSLSIWVSSFLKNAVMSEVGRIHNFNLSPYNLIFFMNYAFLPALGILCALGIHLGSCIMLLSTMNTFCYRSLCEPWLIVFRVYAFHGAKLPCMYLCPIVLVFLES